MEYILINSINTIIIFMIFNSFLSQFWSNPTTQVTIAPKLSIKYWYTLITSHGVCRIHSRLMNYHGRGSDSVNTVSEASILKCYGHD